MLAQQEVILHVKFPRSILFDYGLTEQEATEEMLRAFVLSLYRRDKISSGKAARLLGMHRLDFIRLLANEGISYLDYTSEELAADVQALKEWENFALEQSFQEEDEVEYSISEAKEVYHP